VGHKNYAALGPHSPCENISFASGPCNTAADRLVGGAHNVGTSTCVLGSWARDDNGTNS
jgi:hypothetical protein